MQHILIIEDEPGIYTFLKQGLEEEGYSISIAVDGEQGVELFRTEKPDLILLDWVLPKMDGIDVCKAIRQEDINIPILFLTARDTVQDTIEGLQCGANDYIKKPFSFEELLERIKIHFRNSIEQGILTLGNISLNSQTYEVQIEASDIALTHREYDTGVIDVFINAIRKKLNLDKDNGYIKTVRGVGYIANE